MLVSSSCDITVSVIPVRDQRAVRWCEGPSRAASGIALRGRWKQQLDLQLCSNYFVLIRPVQKASRTVHHAAAALLWNLVREFEGLDLLDLTGMFRIL